MNPIALSIGFAFTLILDMKVEWDKFGTVIYQELKEENETLDIIKQLNSQMKAFERSPAHLSGFLETCRPPASALQRCWSEEHRVDCVG